MADNLDNLGLAPAADLTIQTVTEVKTTSDELPTPAFVTNAMGPEVLLVKGREDLSCVTHETVGSVRVHAEQERDEKVVGVPESLERLLTNPVVSSRVDQQHAEQHDVSGNSTSLGVVNLECNLRADLDTLDIEEAGTISTIQTTVWEIYSLDVMSASVENGEEQHGIGNLSMEPHRLVKRHPSSLGAKPSKNIPAHRHDNNHGVH